MSRPGLALVLSGVQLPAGSRSRGRSDKLRPFFTPMLRISRGDYEAMLGQLLAARPLEGCGLLAGSAGRVRRVYPVANRLASPVAYELAPAQLVAAMFDLEDRGWELLAIYHSHPAGPETPSPADVAQAAYPEALLVVVSLADPGRPVARAFRVGDRQAEEVALRIE
ncbi:MAG: Mov34/MPN/PAD-1 family protein [Candidatus Promineifilaceae bacterium]